MHDETFCAPVSPSPDGLVNEDYGTAHTAV
jgi:hypothetical protein